VNVKGKNRKRKTSEKEELTPDQYKMAKKTD